jgi:uncharacterized protein (DUF2252 family)
LRFFEAQGKTRLGDLLPIRHARMLTSPFAFLRGAAAVMIRDIASAPVTGLTVQACGDMHVSNFGVFASAERNLIFAINDFDETLPGSWEWDVKRLVASAVVCGRFLGFDKTDCEAAARSVVRAYRERMREYAKMGYLELWYSRIAEHDVLGAVSRRARKRFKRIVAKARGRTHMQVFDKMTGRVGGRARILEDAPLITRETKTQAASRSSRPSTASCVATRIRSPWTAASSSPATGSSTSHARWSAWAASALAAGSSCSRARPTTTRCSCNSKRLRLRCSRLTRV